jgi:hypothetical protein
MKRCASFKRKDCSGLPQKMKKMNKTGETILSPFFLLEKNIKKLEKPIDNWKILCYNILAFQVQLITF